MENMELYQRTTPRTYIMLHGNFGNLHSPSTSNARVRYITVTSYFIRCIHYNHTFLTFVCQYSSYFPVLLKASSATDYNINQIIIDLLNYHNKLIHMAVITWNHLLI